MPCRGSIPCRIARTRTRSAGQRGWSPTSGIATASPSACVDATPQMAHPRSDAVAANPVDSLAGGPLIEEMRKVHPGADGDPDGCGEPRVDLHQKRNARAVASELDFGVAFDVDLANQALG